MRFRLVLIFTPTGQAFKEAPAIHTQIVDEVYSHATDAMNAGQEFINNVTGNADCNVSFSVFPGK